MFNYLGVSGGLVVDPKFADPTFQGFESGSRSNILKMLIRIKFFSYSNTDAFPTEHSDPNSAFNTRNRNCVPNSQIQTLY